MQDMYSPPLNMLPSSCTATLPYGQAVDLKINMFLWAFSGKIPDSIHDLPITWTRNQSKLHLCQL